MKIAVIVDTWFPFVGGGQINAWEISKEIASKGHQIDIITRNNGKTDKIRAKNLKVYQLGSTSEAGDTYAKIKFCFESLSFLLNKNYDVVHGHAFLPGFTIALARLIKKVPNILTIHGTSINTSLNNPILKIVEAIIITKIPYSFQITVSRDFLKIPNINNKIKFISNAPNINEFEKTIVPKSKVTTLLFVGRLHPQKNIINLLKAFKKLNRNDIQLLLAGEGPQKQEISEYINSQRLQKVIKILGNVEGKDLARLYKTSHFFILPSLYEGQSLSLLEAFALKLVPIVSAVGDSPFLVRDDVNGFIINDPENVDEIKNTILKALKSKKTLKMEEENFKFIKEHISWKKSAMQTLEIYKSVKSIK